MTFDPQVLQALESNEDLERYWQNDALLHHAVARGCTFPETVRLLCERNVRLTASLTRYQRSQQRFVFVAGD